MNELFFKLTKLLLDYSSYWRTSPFKEPTPVWALTENKLCEWLLTLSEEELEFLQADDERLYKALTSHFAVANEIAELVNIPKSMATKVVHPNPFWHLTIPGRKAEQIEYFSASLGPMQGSVVEWCAGKAHLGRYLCGLHPITVNSLEIDAALVHAGSALVKTPLTNSSSLTLHQCDVLTPSAKQFLHQDSHIMALHACGELHVKLLQGAAEKQVKRISLAPCCYHLIAENSYQALSTPAINSALHLSQEEMRNAVRQWVTSPASVQRKRQKMQAWRLGFDSLQRELHGVDTYLPIPTLPEKLLHNTFAAFCQHLATLKDLSIPPSFNFANYFAHYEAIGVQRFYQASRFELVRMLFRRPLEYWLALDRMIFLTERGYNTTIVQFCPTHLTPRNLLIDATLD